MSVRACNLFAASRPWLLAVALLCAVGMSASALAAETCYQDDTGRIVKRRQPGFTPVPCPPPRESQPSPGPGKDAGATPQATTEQGPEAATFPGGRRPPDSVSALPRPRIVDYTESVPLPDRWRIVDSLGYRSNLLDPYNRNILKSDRPVFDDWFFNLGLISDSRAESRELPTAVGGSSTRFPGENDVFGRSRQRVFSQTVATQLVFFKGDTVFRPPDYEFRLTPVFNYNYASIGEIEGVNVDPRNGRSRSDNFVGLQEAFFDAHLRNVSDRFDFDSLRIGIQPFSSDFRGFLFQDNQLGVRLFGTRDNNQVQYNVGWFRLLEKDTNSGLNSVRERPRNDDVFVFNLYRQDLPVKGFTSQAIVLYNRDREADDIHYNDNGFLVVPAPLGLQKARNYDVVYIGYNGDGHFGRLNLTASTYYAVGSENRGTFEDRKTDISAFFAAGELSVDFSWVRARLSMLYGSGDKNPYDDKATGFDAVFENPQFAGGDTSYWIHQAVPLIGGGGVALSASNAVLSSLRSSKDEGQSNFDNPGMMLIGVGADLDLLPTLRLALNANDLYFADTQVLEAARNQGGTAKHIGADLSAALTWRPLDSQNIVLRASYARLIAGNGFRALFPRQDPDYLLLDVLLAY